MISRNWRERVGEYLEQYSALYHRPASRLSAIGVLREFETFLVSRKGTPVELIQVAKEDLLGYLRHKLDQGRAPATANKHVRTLRCFFRWCVDRQAIAADPTKGVRPLKIVRRRPPIPDKPDVLKLLFYLDCRKDQLFTDLVTLVANTGLRSGEFVYLRPEDVSLERRTLIVRNDAEHRTKDNDERVIPLNDKALEILRRWLSIREAKGGRLLFFGHKAADVKGLAHKFKRRTRAAGVPSITFYSLRHLFATTAASRMTPNQLAAIMGHADPRTTHRWYIHEHALTLTVPQVI